MIVEFTDPEVSFVRFFSFFGWPGCNFEMMPHNKTIMIVQFKGNKYILLNPFMLS